MGFEHIALVREAELPPVQKLLLYALASRADGGGRSWPSIDRLCRDTGLSRRAVQIHLGMVIACRAVERTVHAGRSSEYRLDVATLRALGADKRCKHEAPGSGQLAHEGRTPCAPPAHLLRTPAHPTHPTSASDAPKVKEEVPLNNQKRATDEPATVDNGEASANLPWWRSRSAVMLMGSELDVATAPGEPYAQYKDRVYRAWRDRLYQARNTGRHKSVKQG